MSKIKNFLVCGGGMMGSAIAQILAGLDDAKVTVYDVFPVDVEAKVRNNMNDEGVKNAQMVVECVLEEMEMKQNLFAQLEDYVADDCIFCTNTSVMSPTEISAKCKHRE